MSGFGLQCLDGIGNAYNTQAIGADKENAQMYFDSETYERENEVRYQDRPSGCGHGSFAKVLVAFAVGMLAGQAVRKLFKD